MAMEEKCVSGLIFGSSLTKSPQAFPPGMEMSINRENHVKSSQQILC